jgi:hypothetical protein
MLFLLLLATVAVASHTLPACHEFKCASCKIDAESIAVAFLAAFLLLFSLLNFDEAALNDVLALFGTGALDDDVAVVLAPLACLRCALLICGIRGT